MLNRKNLTKQILLEIDFSSIGKFGTKLIFPRNHSYDSQCKAGEKSFLCLNARLIAEKIGQICTCASAEWFRCQFSTKIITDEQNKIVQSMFIISICA